MSKKNFGYTSISNIKRRLGTWDSRKPGQSPKEMKELLEGADKTLQGTKMKPESQGSIISSNKPESAKVRNPLTIHDRSTGGPRKGHGEYLRNKFYKSDVSQRTGIRSADSPSRTGVIGAEVTRNPSLRKSATDKVKDKVSIKDYGFRQMTKGTAKDEINLDRDYQRKKPDKFIDSIIRHNRGIKKLSDSELRKLEGSSGSKMVQELRQTKPKGVHHTTYRTQGKQDLLEGKPRKTTVSAKAGAGMQMLKAQMRRFGAKQWWQSKTH